MSSVSFVPADLLSGQNPALVALELQQVSCFGCRGLLRSDRQIVAVQDPIKRLRLCCNNAACLKLAAQEKFEPVELTAEQVGTLLHLPKEHVSDERLPLAAIRLARRRPHQKKAPAHETSVKHDRHVARSRR